MAAQFPLSDLSLLPLTSALYPQGRVHVPIFEPRYLAMVRDCARYDMNFGICLILQSEEVGAVASPAAIGTLARIVDFHNREDGLLGIVVEGEQRFRVVRTKVRSDGLIRGEVESWGEDEPEVAVPVEFSLLQAILERLIEQMAPHWQQELRHRYEDAAWVGFRLAELLPLSVYEQQRLLELTDPLLRLAELRDILPRFQKN